MVLHFSGEADAVVHVGIPAAASLLAFIRHGASFASIAPANYSK